MNSVNHAGMVGCDGMDKVQPVLCHAHAFDQAGGQSLDKPELPHMQVFMPVGLVRIIQADENIFVSRTNFFASLLLARKTAPPISILHCCFRI